jgi:hypothetical protein
MEARISQLRSAVRLPDRVRAVAADRVNLALGAVFVAGAVFYLWTAGTSYTLELNGSQTDPYNLLANAFLHLHLSVGRPPAGLLKLPEPYNPVANSAFQLHPRNIHDFALYHGKLYLTWGPTPVLVLLVPLHLVGLEPSTSLTAAIFAIVGLGFALAVLRVVLRQLGTAPLWMCALAAFTLALSSVVPFLLRRPEVYEEAIASGFCFAMAGIWLAVSALLERRASLPRLVLMSLCFGLAVGARPTLAPAALVLVPVYLSFRATRAPRGLLIALIAPLGVCGLLLALYNQVRFGSPLEVGTKYALAGFDQYTAHFGDASYVVPGAWYYLLSPPRPSVLFPFLQVAPPPESYPGTLPANYQSFELTAGLLPMAPIVVFLTALPWIWRRRPKLLGSLGAPLLILAGAGAVGLLFLSYEFYATTERYEVDFATLFLLGALAAWLALSAHLRGRRRWLVRIGGALLALWGCFAGLAIGFTGYADLLQVDYPATWSSLENISSPLSRAIAFASGGPVLAEVNAVKVIQDSPVTYTNLNAPTKAFGLSVGERAQLTIVSPDTRTAALVANITPAIVAGGRARLSTSAAVLLVRGPGHVSNTYTIQPGGGERRIPVRLSPGLDHLVLRAQAVPASGGKPAIPAAQQALVFTNLSLAGNG